MCIFRSTKAEQQASNREAPPEHVEVERQKPERGLTFDMRGGQGRQPLDVPLDGRVRQHCVFARMPGVFEPCTRLDHLGWLRYLASQTPLSRSIGSLASCSATGPFGSW